MRNYELRVRGIVTAVLPDAVTREIDIDVTPEVVWSIVTEARHLAGWFSDEAEIDLRPGGAMLLTWHGHGVYRARVETVEPPVTVRSARCCATDRIRPRAPRPWSL